MSPEAVLEEYDALLLHMKEKKRKAQRMTVFVFLLRLAMLIQGVQGFIVAIEFKRDSSKHCSLPLPELQIANGVLSAVNHVTAFVARCITHFSADTDVNRLWARALMLLSNVSIAGLLTVLVLGGVWAWSSDADDKCDSALVDSATASASVILAVMAIAIVINVVFYKQCKRKRHTSKATKERRACILKRAQSILAQRQAQQVAPDASTLDRAISVNDLNDNPFE